MLKYSLEAPRRPSKRVKKWKIDQNFDPFLFWGIILNFWKKYFLCLICGQKWVDFLAFLAFSTNFFFQKKIFFSPQKIFPQIWNFEVRRSPEMPIVEEKLSKKVSAAGENFYKIRPKMDQKWLKMDLFYVNHTTF